MRASRREKSRSAGKKSLGGSGAVGRSWVRLTCGSWLFGLHGVHWQFGNASRIRNRLCACTPTVSYIRD